MLSRPESFFGSMIEFFVGIRDSEKLKMEIKASKENILKRNFGVIGGDVYFIKASPEINLAKLLNTLDHKDEGRKGTKVADYLFGGPFLAARTDIHAKFNHDLFNYSLSRPKHYIQLVIDALQNFLLESNEFDLKDFATQPIRNALIRGLFHTDFTPELAKSLLAFTKISEERDESFATKIFFHLLGAYHPNLLSLKSSLNTAKAEYLKSAEEFIAQQADRILKELHLFATEKTTNILTLSILELIQEEQPELREDRERLYEFVQNIDEKKLQHYLKNVYIRTLPASVLPGDNIIKMISCALTNLCDNHSLLAELRQHLTALDAFSEVDTVYNFIEADKKQNGLLHCFYLETLRCEAPKSAKELEFDSLIWRYTKEEIKVDSTTIPKNSMIVIINSLQRFDEKFWKDPSVFNPARFFNDQSEFKNQLAQRALSVFSDGERKCPGYKITEYILKTFIAYVALNYDLIIANRNDKKLQEVAIQLSPVNGKLELANDSSPSIMFNKNS